MVFGAWARHTSMLIKVQAEELLGATLSLFYVSHRKNSRPEGGAFIRSLQTGFLGKKVEEQMEADRKVIFYDRAYLRKSLTSVANVHF